MVLLVTEGHGHGSREAVGVEVILLVAEGAEYGSGVAVGVKVALLVAEGVVELGVGLSLSSSQSSATDLSMRSEYGENYRELLFTTIAILIIFLLVLSSKE